MEAVVAALVLPYFVLFFCNRGIVNINARVYRRCTADVTWAGIGHESAKAMAKAGAHVILATRNPDKADT